MVWLGYRKEHLDDTQSMLPRRKALSKRKRRLSDVLLPRFAGLLSVDFACGSAWHAPKILADRAVREYTGNIICGRVLSMTVRSRMAHLPRDIHWQRALAETLRRFARAEMTLRQRWTADFSATYISVSFRQLCKGRSICG